MDAIDRQILTLLQKDGRRTFDDIGREVGLSPPSVSRRIERLRERGALRGFTAVVDPGALGLGDGGAGGAVLRAGHAAR